MPAGPADAKHFLDRFTGSLKMVQGDPAGDQVEGTVRIRHLPGIALFEDHVGHAFRFGQAPALAHHLRSGVQCGNPADVGSDGAGQ